ncbi:MAG: butyrate kinase [Candidatus Zixiibacteriota bacterium]|nr:MAG: butyrate kinase [candidate division Zixibacteria bacterium]
MRNQHKILSINPGATSTRVALYLDERPLKVEVIRHSPEDLSSFKGALDQLDYRKELVLEFLRENEVKVTDLAAVVGRGGPFKPLESGTYRVSEKMLSDIHSGEVQADHPSNLGALIAHEIVKGTGVPSFIVDPVSVDEFIPEARISGLPQMERRSLSHALNMKMVARKAAKKLGKKYEELNLVIVHLGSGISVSSHRRGRMIDVNNANDMGPFSPQRVGALPVTGLAKLCFSGEYTQKEMIQLLTKKGGLLAHLGTDNVEEVERRVDGGDQKAKLVYDALVYQIAKEIGAMATTLEGRVDAVLLTGGIANSQRLTDCITRKVEFLGQVLIFPGEDEMEALTLGGLRVVSGQEDAKKY